MLYNEVKISTYTIKDALILTTSCVCVFQCQPTALLLASGSTQGGQIALSVVYFLIMHRLGRPHYVRDEYLYSVREKVEVGVIVSVTVLQCNCVVWDDDRKEEGETRCRLITCSSRKAPRGPPGLNVPINIHTTEGFGI